MTFQFSKYFTNYDSDFSAPFELAGVEMGWNLRILISFLVSQDFSIKSVSRKKLDPFK